MVTRISTGSPLEKSHGYSRAIVDGNTVHVSGTTGYDYEKMEMPEDAGEQARNALKTIATTLDEAGSSLADVVRVRYYLSDHAHEEAVVKVVGEAFRDIRPAATMVICGLVAPEMKIEIEVTARRGSGG